MNIIYVVTTLVILEAIILAAAYYRANRIARIERELDEKIITPPNGFNPKREGVQPLTIAETQPELTRDLLEA